MSVDAALPYMVSYELQAIRSNITAVQQRVGTGDGSTEIQAAYDSVSNYLNAAVEKENPPPPETKPADEQPPA